MIEEDRFPTEFSLFKALSEVSYLEKDIENSDLSTLIRYMLVMDVISKLNLTSCAIYVLFRILHEKR